MSASASFVKSLLAQCCLGGICEWVVCPGARNMALLQVLAAAEDLVKWTHFDERSAAFFALGRIQDMGLPVAVVTTSGTAAAELLPAVVEAYYERRPLLLLTADRPADYRGSAAPQAIEQADLFGIYAPTIDLETPDSLPEDILEDWDYASPLHITSACRTRTPPGIPATATFTRRNRRKTANSAVPWRNWPKPCASNRAAGWWSCSADWTPRSRPLPCGSRMN